VTYAPADLLAIAHDIAAATGLPRAEIGIVGNAAHVADGTGYHLGRDQLNMRANPYSARLPRDLRGLTDAASAMDINAAWRVGGRRAWLRFNALLGLALQRDDPALASIRAINFTLDGTTRHRIDRVHHWRVESSTDTVAGHTHLEWFRDTEGSRGGACRTRLIELIIEAIGGPHIMGLSPEEHKQLGDVAYTETQIHDPADPADTRIPEHVAESRELGMLELLAKTNPGAIADELLHAGLAAQVAREFLALLAHPDHAANIADAIGPHLTVAVPTGSAPPPAPPAHSVPLTAPAEDVDALLDEVEDRGEPAFDPAIIATPAVEDHQDQAAKAE
jgi:hypothetical protein